MDVIDTIYNNSLQENERNLKFWKNYLNNLKDLDFSAYSDKLKVPILVPIGSNILFRGELQHTNEVTVALGADYFAKCSIAQAEILREHRIKDAQAKLDIYKKERDYLHNQFTFSKEKVFHDEGQNITEHYTLKEDEEWRLKHRENVRKYKQSKDKEEIAETNDEDLWSRLEELELQEEMENEIAIKAEETNENTNNIVVGSVRPIEDPTAEKSFKNTEDSNLEILQKVLDKQNELEQKISDLKNRERSNTRTEEDLLSRLDEMELLEELEDEMDRVDDIIIGNEDIECVLHTDSDNNNEDEELKPAPKIKRSVSFADADDETEVLELNFKHSDVLPDSKQYNPDKGIEKPSDIYEAYKSLFHVETTSILKKSSKDNHKKVHFDTNPQYRNPPTVASSSNEDKEEERIILLKDVVEKHEPAQCANEASARPTSLFKQKRQQRK